LVGVNWDALFAVNTRAVVGYNRENCVRPESFPLGGCEKLAETVIRVFDRVDAPLFIWILRDSPFGIGVVAMIRNGKNRTEEGLASIIESAEFFDATRE